MGTGFIFESCVGAYARGTKAKWGGINHVHLGVLATVSLSVDFTSPPYGVCLLIASQIEEVSITKAIFAIIPNVGLVILVSVLSLWVPEIMIALPKTVMPNVFDLK